MLNNPRFYIVVIILIFTSLACKLVSLPGNLEIPQITSTELPAKLLTPSIFPSITPTNTLTPSLTSLPSVTPTSLPTNVAARVRAEAINLRQGPGTLFPVLASLSKDTWVTVMGKALGDEWLLVKSNEGQGWLAVTFTDLFQNPVLNSLTVIPFDQGYVVRGQVIDIDGKPIGGVAFGITQGSPSIKPRAEATSLLDGNFYAYLPSSAAGDWRLSLVGIDCTSPIMDEGCNYNGEFDPMWVDISIPHDAPLVFTYTP
jgi:hypothetical protein